MNNTKENVIRLLETKRDSAFDMRKITNEQYDKDRYLHFAMAYQEAIWLLTDNKFFKEIADTYK